MRALRLLLALLGSGLVASCGATDGGVLSVSPTEHNFGRVRHGLIRVTKFQVKNTSDRDVALIFKPSCGCFTVLDGGRRSLEPGEGSEIRLRFDAGQLGAQKLQGKFLDIFTDHPSGHRTRIPITGEVYNAVRVDPTDLRLGRLLGDAATFEPRTIHLRPVEDGATVAVDALNVIPRDIFDIHKASVDGGVTLTIRLKPNVSRPRAPIMVALDGRTKVTSRSGTVEIVPIRARIHGYWDADPLPKKD